MFKKIKLIKNYSLYVNSLLTWVKKTEINCFEFTLKDIDIFDIPNASIQPLDDNEVTFLVDFFGNFVSFRH